MKVYLDHAATTPLDEGVFVEMTPYFTAKFGNPSSAHLFGREAVVAVDEARSKIASLLHCKSKEIYFTSGGTESDNHALRGVLPMLKNKGKHIISTKIEHPAILSTLEYLKSEGYEITLIDAEENGVVDKEKVFKAVRNDTVLVAVMLVNNEVGTIQPVAEIADFCKERGILCYTDAVQAMSSVKIDLSVLKVDMLGFSAHKFYGPKGVGALFVRSGTPLSPLLFGGEQERGKRAGTTNTPGVVGMAAALEKCVRNLDENNRRICALKEKFCNKVLSEIPGTHLNGDPEKTIAGCLSLTFDGVKAESLLMLLDREGVAASAGSACTSGSIEPSHVLLSMKKSASYALSTVRFSFGKDNTEEEIDYAVNVLKKSVSRLREGVPLIKMIEKEGFSV